MLEYRSPLERLCIKLWCMARANALPLSSGMIFGLLAHMFAFTNKLMNADEVTAIFSKGATIESGRWALELLEYIFPNLSVPWLWGMISIFLISIAACITLRIFNIKHSFFKVLLPAMFVVFPSQTGVFCFMFTSSSYAVSFLLAVLAVWIFVNMKKRPAAWIVSCLMLAFSIGVYQAYVAISASFFVMLMIQRLLENEDAVKVFKQGVGFVLMLLASLVVYYVFAFAAVKLSGGEFIYYAVDQETRLLFKIALAYNALVKALLSGYFGFVESPLSFICHLVGLGLCAVLAVMEIIKLKDMKRRGLVLLCIILLPLSMNCIFLISSTQIIHSLVLYSFIVIYVFAAILLDRSKGIKLLWLRDVVVLCMLLTVVNNVYLANKVYLVMHIQYENAYSFYSGVMEDVYDAEGYNTDLSLVIYGEYKGLPELEQLDTGELFGPSENLVNIYTKDHFLKNYLGYGGEYASPDESRALYNDPRVAEMPAYPYDGSVKVIDDYVVVNLG